MSHPCKVAFFVWIGYICLSIMANKRKGQLTVWSGWEKHLKKIGKRFYWKAERCAENKLISEELKKED